MARPLTPAHPLTLILTITVTVTLTVTLPQRCIERGVGFHHAGLAEEEKKVVEHAVAIGAIRALCCTSSLAEGVNMPIRRVIIRDAFLGVQTNPIEPIRYRQMAGRAGRHGLEKLGESFLLVDDARSCERMRAVMTAEVPQLVPSLTALSKPWPWPWPWP